MIPIIDHNIGDFDGSNVNNDDETDQVACPNSTSRSMLPGSNSQYSKPMQTLNSIINQTESTPVPNQSEDLRVINSHSDISKRMSLTPSNRMIPLRHTLLW